LRSKPIGVLVFVLALSAPLCLALASVQVSSQSARSLDLKLELTGIRDIKDAGGRWAGLEVKDFISSFDSSLGLNVPVRSYIVAIPIGADVTCQIVDPVYYEIDPSAVGRAPGSGGLAQLGGKPADIVAKGYMGSQLVASLRISPLVYDDVRGMLRVYTRFGVRFDFGAPALGEGRAGQDAGDDGSYEATLASALVNYEQGRNWRRRLPSSLTAGDYFSGSPTWVKIRVDTTGVYCVTGRDLEGLGVALSSISAQTLRLYAGLGLPLHENLLEPNPSWMRQVPVRVSRATGALAGGDSIIFYALGAHDWKNLYDKSFGPGEYNKNFYSDFNCYWLTWGGTFQEDPARMAKVGPPPCVGCSPYEPPSFFERIHVEQDNVRDVTVPAEDGWYWRPFLKGSVISVFARTPLPDVSVPARVKVRVVDYSQGECPRQCFRVILRVNSGVIGDWVWDVDQLEHPQFDMDTTATLANLGLQRIEIDMPQNPPPTLACSNICERLYLAWYELTYWRRFAADRGALFFGAPDTTATVRYVIPGFTTRSLYVLDVTDQFAVRELTGAQVSGESAFSVAILDTTSKGDPRRYAIVSPQAMRKPLGMSREEIANIRNQSGRAYLVITHKDLLGPAQTIADFHNGQVVTTDQVYNEFGWGVPDAAAIRDFLRWRLAHGTPVARVLLFGDASWDIKGYLSYGAFPNYVPTYERRFLPPTYNPYSSDDWLVYLEPAPGDASGNCYWPTVPLSRIPASSPEEGEEMVARILDYTTNPELGVWQNRIMLVADDDRIGTSCPGSGDRSNNLHTTYAEELGDVAYPQVFDRTKVYLTEYPVESTGLKTLARRAFVKALNEGVLITNYVGHGDEYRLAQEEVFNPASVNLVATGRKLTFFIAASCNVSRFDGPAGSSMAEELFRRREGGTIGSLASTHLCFPQPNQMLNMNFIFAMFDSSRSVHPTAYIADALQVAKVRTAERIQSRSTNSEMYALFGDPAQRLASPELQVVITKPASDTLERRSPYHFTATVSDDGVAATSFDGTADTRLRESEKTDGYTTCQGDHLDYDLPGHEIYRGKGDVASGALAFDALIPVDAREGKRGAVRCFVSDGQRSGSGLLDSLVIHGESVSADNVGPEISLKAAGRELASGDTVVVGEHLTLDLVDDSGVAVKAKSIFIPALSIQIDDGERQDITDSVYAVNGDFTQSIAHFDVPSLTIDSHKFAVTAFDNNNNTTTEEYTLLVGSSGGQVGNVVYAYPNPAAEFCYVICECDRLVAVDISVYTVSGRKIWEQASPEPRSYHQIRWDGADTEGDRVANGTYLVKVEARDPMESSFKFSKTIVVALIR